jgi:hypothetical protein
MHEKYAAKKMCLPVAQMKAHLLTSTSSSFTVSNSSLQDLFDERLQQLSAQQAPTRITCSAVAHFTSQPTVHLRNNSHNAVVTWTVEYQLAAARPS